MGIGDWGLGIGDWGLGPIANWQGRGRGGGCPLSVFFYVSLVLKKKK